MAFEAGRDGFWAARARPRLGPLAPGLTPRAVLDKFAAIRMLDVHLSTTDGRTLILSRFWPIIARARP